MSSRVLTIARKQHRAHKPQGQRVIYYFIARERERGRERERKRERERGRERERENAKVHWETLNISGTWPLISIECTLSFLTGHFWNKQD